MRDALRSLSIEVLSVGGVADKTADVSDHTEVCVSCCGVASHVVAAVAAVVLPSTGATVRCGGAALQ
jgi:hypothetical protein